MRFTFPDIIAHQSQRYAEKPYLVWTDASTKRERLLSYSDYEQKVKVLATHLRHLGVSKGTHVAAILPNSADIIISYGAISFLGAIIVPMNPSLTAEELQYMIADAEVRVVIAAAEVLQKLHLNPETTPVTDVIPMTAMSDEQRTPLSSILAETNWDESLEPDCTPEDTLMILYTSGTTGTPKGAMLTHHGVLRTAQAIVDFLESDSNEQIVNLLPMTHTFSICVEILHALLTGGTLYIRSGTFNPRSVLEQIERQSITFLCGVPSIFTVLNETLNRANFDTSSLRVGLVGGSSVPVETLKQFEEKTGILIVEGYGQTELSPLASLQPPYPDKRRLSSCGIAVPGTEVRIVDASGSEVGVGQEGELLVRGFNVMQGYWNRPEETAVTITEDGWLHTGDVFRQDEDGYLYMVDRLKDVIIYGGFNVYPKEVESVLHRNPAVEEAHVVGVPDAVKGEYPVAFIRIREGANLDIVKSELMELSKSYLAEYKRPRSYFFVTDFPRTASGKVSKKDLRQSLMEQVITEN